MSESVKDETKRIIYLLSTILWGYHRKSLQFRLLRSVNEGVVPITVLLIEAGLGVRVSGIEELTSDSALKGHPTVLIGSVSFRNNPILYVDPRFELRMAEEKLRDAALSRSDGWFEDTLDKRSPYVGRGLSIFAVRQPSLDFLQTSRSEWWNCETERGWSHRVDHFHNILLLLQLVRSQRSIFVRWD